MDPDLSLNSICSYLNISTSYFSTIFKDLTGETFTEVLIRTRMEKAKELLENTTMKNYEIAEKVGFADPHYFGISFKKMTGCTPTEYARRNVNERYPVCGKDHRKIQKYPERDLCGGDGAAFKCGAGYNRCFYEIYPQFYFENSSVYTQNIVQQMNQNIDSYIDYMENIAYMISSNEDVQQYLFGENVDDDTRERLINQFKTILDGRSDIRNLGIIGINGRKLINDGKQSVNPDLKLSTQEWYLDALQKPEGPLLTSSHVQHIISGERPWVITLSRGSVIFPTVVRKRESFLLT